MLTTDDTHDVATFGPTLKLLLHEESGRQLTIAQTLDKEQSVPGDDWDIAAGRLRAYALVLNVLANKQVDGLAQAGGFRSDASVPNLKAFFPAVADLLLAEARRLEDLATTTLTASPRFEKYRKFLIAVAKSTWSSCD